MNNTVLQRKLDQYFEADSDNKQKLFDKISLFVNQMESQENDLYILADLLDKKSLVNIVEYFGGSSLRIPTNEQLQDNLILSMCFYLREIEKWDWKQIKEFIDIPEDRKDIMSPTLIGRKVNKLKTTMESFLMDMLKEADIKNLSKDEVKDFTQGGSNE